MQTDIEQEIARNIARILLHVNAVKLQPDKPFTWASGWKSPIYCDNRGVLSHPEERNTITEAFTLIIKQKYPQVEIVAGVATGAIAWGVLAADKLKKPAIYVRTEAKKHGLTNQVEGQYLKGQKIVVIEDLISTGGSSIKAIEALRNAGLEVMGMISIFTYEFQQAVENLQKAKIETYSLSNYSTLIQTACELEYTTKEQVETLQQWRENPEQWGK